MKKFLYLLTSGMIVASFAVSAQTEENGEAAMGQMKENCMTTTGQYQTIGTVDDIDLDNGVLTLKNGAPDMVDPALADAFADYGALALKGGGPDMTLHFPPDFIKELKKGDIVTVSLGLNKE